MRRVALLSLLLLLCLPARAADTLRVTGPAVRLAGGPGAMVMRPVWSPDGAHIAFTGPRYEGLWVIRPDGSGQRQVTDEPAAGFGFAWSSDGQALAARVARYDGPRRFNAVKLFDLGDRSARLVTDYRSVMEGLPRWTADDAQVYLYTRGKLEAFATGRAAAKNAPQAPLLFVQDDALARADAPDAPVREITPFEGARLLNLAVSPDGRKAAFEVMGGNLFVVNVDGTGLVDLGRGYRPTWSPDGAYVAFMVTEDDGHAFTAADLYAARADGSARIRLTDTPDRLEMNPSWSPDGRWLAFDEMHEGALYLLPLAR